MSSSLGGFGMEKIPLSRTVPAAMNRAIGRIMVADAFLEHQLQQIVVALTGCGPKEARLALREPRAVDRLDLIKQLLSVHGIDVPIRKKLGNDLKDITQERDCLAHGCWSKRSDGQYVLIVTAGSWVLANNSSLKRKIHPAGVLTGSDNLAELLAFIDKLIEEILKLRGRLKPRSPHCLENLAS